MRMDSQKCRALLRAVELGSITAAARELGYSVSGMTRMLDSLEAEIGLPLLVRGRHGVALNEAGKKFLPLLRELAQAETQITALSAAISGLAVGELYIGSYFSVAAIWLPEILRQFQEDYPGIHVHVREEGNKALIQAVARHELDCAILSKPEDFHGDWLPLYRDRLVAWIPQSFALAQKEAIQPQDFNGIPFIEPLPHQHTNVEAFLQKYDVHPDIRLTTSDTYTCWSMVEAGLGVSMDNELRSAHWHGNVKVVPFATGDAIELGIALLDRKSASPALKKFIAYVQRFVEQWHY